MHIGGVQKSLVNLLGEISDKHEITLLLFYGDGELKNNIPSNVNIIYSNKFTQIMGMSQQEAKNSGILTLLWRSFWTVLTKIFGIGFSFAILSRMQKVHGKYDVGISFMQNSDYKMFYGGCNEFVINSVKADKKISFVHCDFSCIARWWLIILYNNRTGALLNQVDEKKCPRDHHIPWAFHLNIIFSISASSPFVRKLAWSSRA